MSKQYKYVAEIVYRKNGNVNYYENIKEKLIKKYIRNHKKLTRKELINNLSTILMSSGINTLYRVETSGTAKDKIFNKPDKVKTPKIPKMEIIEDTRDINELVKNLPLLEG